MSLDWGSVPAWVGALSTGTSLLIASVSYRQSVVDRAKTQAILVSAWFVEAGGRLNTSDPPVAEGTLFVRNASSAAVSMVVVHHSQLGSHGEPRSVTTWRAIGPEMTVSVPSPSAEAQIAPTRLAFVDASGRPWVRTATGKLIEFKRRQQQSIRATLERNF